MRYSDAPPEFMPSERMVLRDPTNLDLVRSIYAAWERGDFSSVEWADPEIEYVFADGPSPGSWIGLTEMAWVWREWLDAWEEFRVEAEEYRRLDGERVLVLVHFGGRGKTSGLEVERTQARSASLFHIHSGKVTRFVTYFDRERACADLGVAAA
jgi:ketosteroid isomerase-like protein